MAASDHCLVTPFCRDQRKTSVSPPICQHRFLDWYSALNIYENLTAGWERKKRGRGTCAGVLRLLVSFSISRPCFEFTSSPQSLEREHEANGQPLKRYPRFLLLASGRSLLYAICAVNDHWSLAISSYGVICQLSLHPRSSTCQSVWRALLNAICVVNGRWRFPLVANSNFSHILCCITNVGTHAIKLMPHMQGDMLEIE